MKMTLNMGHVTEPKPKIPLNMSHVGRFQLKMTLNISHVTEPESKMTLNMSHVTKPQSKMTLNRILIGWSREGYQQSDDTTNHVIRLRLSFEQISSSSIISASMPKALKVNKRELYSSFISNQFKLQSNSIHLRDALKVLLLARIMKCVGGHLASNFN